MRYLLILAGFIFPVLMYGQSSSPKEMGREDTAKFYIGLRNKNFFRNNEYFNPYVKGYTLIGSQVDPYLALKLGTATTFRGGVHLLKYSGIKEFSQVQPIISLEQKLSPGFSVIMGTLQQNNNHQMLDPMYHRERKYTDAIENGLQFLYESEKLVSDIWLNWKNYIFQESPEQEIFEVGASVFPVIVNNNQLQIQLPLLFIARHRGGQIDTSDKPLQSTFNWSVGPKLSFPLEGFFMKWLHVENYYLLFQDISSQKQLAFEAGEAYYGRIALQNENWQTAVSYWISDRFIPLAGNPLFSVVSDQNSIKSVNRELLSMEIFYRKNFGSTKLKTGVEFYYDVIHRQIDYSFGIYLSFYPEYFIKGLSL